MKNYLTLLSDQSLRNAAAAADVIAAAGHEGGRIVAEVAGDAIAEELDARRGRP